MIVIETKKELNAFKLEHNIKRLPRAGRSIVIAIPKYKKILGNEFDIELFFNENSQKWCTQII
jgi:hypothetical protein